MIKGFINKLSSLGPRSGNRGSRINKETTLITAGFRIPCGPPARNGSKIGVRAFTLIELLVVVLIIGILSAIALPQYRKAVERAHAAEAKIMLRAIANAHQVYYMANGTYANDLEDLDIKVPGSDLDSLLSKQTENFRYGPTGAGSALNSFALAVRLPYCESYELAIFPEKEGIWCYQIDNKFSPGKDFCQNESDGHSEVMPSGYTYWRLR